MAVPFSKFRLAIIGVGALAIGSIQSAYATSVDFEDLSGPSTFAEVASPGAQTITEGIATFSGGVILTAATNLPADETSIYGTADFANTLPQYTNPVSNPLTVTFTSPVTNFFLDVLNGNTVNVNYTVADNAGHSQTFNLAPNTNSGVSTIGFAATGTIITITAGPADGGCCAWDFFIDNVHFNEPLPPNLQTPLPAALPLFASGAGVLGFMGWRRKRKAIAFAA
jgi:hypothetical protein